jgi:uncharacterized protein (DUF1697 family)
VSAARAPAPEPSEFVALLYSITLGDGGRLVMADLRALATELGVGRPRTVVATGNLLFEAPGAEARGLEALIEPAFAARFGRDIAIVVREAEGWRRMMAGNPFRAAAEAAPAQVAVRVMRAPLPEAAAARLAPYRTGEERIAVVEGDLWLHLPHGSARSRLANAVTPARFGVGTFRNWNTVRRIGAMLGR